MFLWISILRYRFYQQSNDFSKIEEGPLDSLQPNTFHPKILVPVRLEILLWTRINTFSPGSQPHLFLDVGQPVYNDPTGGTVSYFRWWLTFGNDKPLGDAYWLLRIQQNKMYQLLGRFLALDFFFHNALDTRSFISFMALNSATFSAAAAVKCKRNTLWLACWGGAISSVANIAWRPKKETRAGHWIVER